MNLFPALRRIAHGGDPHAFPFRSPSSPREWFLIGVLTGLTLLPLGVWIGWSSGGNRTALPAWTLPVAVGLAAAGLALLVALLWRWMRGRMTALETRLAETDARLAAALRLSQRFAQVESEEEAASLALQSCMEVVGARGASFVPFDSHGFPMPATAIGDLPAPPGVDWAERLSSAQVRSACESCQGRLAHARGHCPLLPAVEAESLRLICLPLQRGDRQLGIVNLYFSPDRKIDAETVDFLQASVDEMSLVVDALRLRQQELDTLRQMRALRTQDRQDLLRGELESALCWLSGRMACLSLDAGAGGDADAPLIVGDGAPDERERVVAAAMDARRLERPTYRRCGSGESPAEEREAVLLAPVRGHTGDVLGGLAMEGVEGDLPQRRQLEILGAVANQLATLSAYSRFVGDLEYQAVMAERTRLAREIHDGLAQTLGFLKLNTAQVQSYLDKGDVERVRSALLRAQTTLEDAYAEARQAIDGLRLSPEEGLEAWLRRAAREFATNSGLRVTVSPLSVRSEISPEVQSQLIRIVQEALANVRRHARARRVWISCEERRGDLWLRVRDDGQGFCPTELVGISQYGLTGMRERAGLIGGDFQIQSRSGEGTTIELRVPLGVREPHT